MTPFDRALARAERLERECLEWQAALHHAETEARQCGFTGSIREPGPALLAILQERDEAREQAEAYNKLAEVAIEGLRPLEESEHKFAALYQEARAQAARLVEALRKAGACWRCGGKGEATFFGCHPTVIERPCKSCKGDGLRGEVRAALASTDSRAWLNEQIAAELESWRAARAIKPECVVEVDERIAELRRKEGI